MFNWLFRKKDEAGDAARGREALAAFCQQRGWRFFEARSGAQGLADVDYWIPARVSISAWDGHCQATDDEGTEFICGNAGSLKFCVCTVGTTTVYVSRNWKRLPNLLLSATPREAQSALTHARLARSYALEAEQPEAANRLFTPQVERMLLKQHWNLRVHDDWVTCHQGAAKRNGNALDDFINEAAQLLAALQVK